MRPGGHGLTSPVKSSTVMIVVAFHTSEEPWKGSERNVRRATRADALRDFTGHGQDVTKILQLIDEKLNVVGLDHTLLLNTRQWAIFYLHDNPVPSFYQGKSVCLVTLRIQRLHTTALEPGSASKIALSWLHRHPTKRSTRPPTLSWFLLFLTNAGGRSGSGYLRAVGLSETAMSGEPRVWIVFSARLSTRSTRGTALLLTLNVRRCVNRQGTVSRESAVALCVSSLLIYRA